MEPGGRSPTAGAAGEGGAHLRDQVPDIPPPRVCRWLPEMGGSAGRRRPASSAPGAQVELEQAVPTLPPSTTPALQPTHRQQGCQIGTTHNEGKNILFRFINLKMKHACRQRDRSSQSVIVEPHAADTGLHSSCRV